MDQWNGNVRVPYNVPRPLAHENPLSFLYNCNYDHFPVLEMKQPSTMQAATTPHHQHDPPLFPTLIDNKNQLNYGGITDMAMDHHMIYDNNSNNMINIYHNDPKKKRLSNEQLESLENSFQEEIKLDPERKQRLAKELGLQPRQIAVWFQNRRARWKAKQLERLYDVLKQEYDAISKEKHKLQQEVLSLRAILKDQVVMSKKMQQVISTETSNDETVESTSIPSDNNKPMTTDNITTTTDNIIINNNDNNNNSNKQIADQSTYALDDYNHVMMAPYNNWAAPA